MPGEPLTRADFHFELPPDRIAQRPCEPRDHCRLMVLGRATGAVQHARFDALGTWLRPGDLLVLNDTRVIPARLYGRKPTGGWMELLLCEEVGSGRWKALVRGRGHVEPGGLVHFDGEAGVARLIRRLGEGAWEIAFEATDARALIDRIGRMPLPPYIPRARGEDPLRDADRAWYQTVFARTPGAIAAPTAGLHFTPELLDRLRSAGVEQARITLHVGPGTFRPVKVDDLSLHRMDPEPYEIAAEAAEQLNAARRAGRRIVAVGTTVTRTLEAACGADGFTPGTGQTDLFLRPGSPFRVVGALLTNFHLPEGTPLMLTAAFAGRESVLAAYRVAVTAGYQFFSYGDAMLIV